MFRNNLHTRLPPAHTSAQLRAKCLVHELPSHSLRSTTISGLREVAWKYQGLLLDQFGVLHDGRQAYNAAIISAQHAAQQGLKMMIVSNSSRRTGGTLGRLSSLGYSSAWFYGAVTSGELTHRYLATRPDDFWQALGQHCVHITWSTRGSVNLGELDLQGCRRLSIRRYSGWQICIDCDLNRAITDEVGNNFRSDALPQVTEEPQEAGFVLVHGTEAVGLKEGGERSASFDELQRLLKRCAECHLPMVVANPDLVTVDGAELVVMPGTLAAAYQQMGGKVQLMGKPDPVIYTAVAQQLQLPSEQLLAVGDSMEHDIAGAAAAGLQTLFIMGGIHAAELKVQPGGEGFDAAAFSALCSRFDVVPTYTMAYLQW